MFNKKILFSTTLYSLIGMAFLYTPPAVADGFSPVFDLEIAQGDGDPEEVDPDMLLSETVEDKQLQSELKADEKEEASDEAVATITAEGDFVVPTYLLPVEENPQALQKETSSKEVVTQATTQEPVVSDKPVASNEPVVSAPVQKTVTVTTTKTVKKELPIVVTKDTQLIPLSPAEAARLKQEEQQKTVSSVQEEVKEEPSTASVEEPQTASPSQTRTESVQKKEVVSQKNTKSDSDTSTNATKKATQSTSKDTVANDETLDIDALLAREQDHDISVMRTNGLRQRRGVISKETLPSNKPLLLPLAPLPEMNKDSEGILEPRVPHIVPSEYADQMLEAVSANTEMPFIMPQEIKVSFYPNATEFSGQTIKWIKAFSAAALNDPRKVIDIRISRQDKPLQYKRYLVIRNTLIGSGLSTHQIQITYTNRSPNSLILRMIQKPEETETIVSKSALGRSTEKKATKW